MVAQNAEHLVVGGGVLALLVAERLLARGATDVLILGGTGVTSEHGGDSHALDLGTGLPAYRELEERGRTVLGDCAGELGFDAAHRTCGSALFPLFLESEGVETLDAQQARDRGLGLTLDDDEEAAFLADDGFLEGDTVAAALLASVRERGALLATTAELFTLTDTDAAFEYVASTHHGSARRVYLVSGTANRRALERLGLETELTVSTWYRFELETPSCPAGILRLEDEGAIVVSDGDGGLLVLLPAEHDGSVIEPSVDWSRLEAFRKAREGLISALAGARVRRGSARNLLDLDARPPGIVRAHHDRLLAAGALGPHLFPLGPAIADMMAAESV